MRLFVHQRDRQTGAGARDAGRTFSYTVGSYKGTTS